MRTKDRLDELQHRARRAGVCGDEAPAPTPAATRALADVDALLREVEPVRRWILDVERNTQLVRRLRADPAYCAAPLLQEQLGALVTASDALGLKVCGALRQLEERARGAGAGAAPRVARLQLAATRRLYADALARHRDALLVLRDQQRRLLTDQLKLTHAALSAEECEQLLDDNNIALFVDNVRAESAAARLALRDAEAQREELARAERSLRSVRDLFLQLAHLVAAQQEQIDSVEYFALQATEHVESGGEELLHGTTRRRKAGKKKMGLIVCAATGCLVLLLVLLCS